MGNAVIATPVLSDAATLSAGSAAASLPVGNLQTMQPSEVWRATDLASAYVVADLGSALEINLAALLHTNASSAATWRVRAASSEAGLTSAPGYDSGSATLWPTTGLEDWDTVNAVLWLGASPQTFRWWRIDVSDSGNADGFLQAGRLYIADAWQPTKNIQFGSGLGWDDESPQPRAVGGQTFPVRREPRRVLDFTLSYLDEDEMLANAFEIDRKRARSRDILVLPDPDATTHMQRKTIYGRQQELTPIINRKFDLYEKRFRIEELLP